MSADDPALKTPSSAPLPRRWAIWPYLALFGTAAAAWLGWMDWQTRQEVEAVHAREACLILRWELSIAKRQAEIFGDASLVAYFREQQLPPCPNGGHYDLGAFGQSVRCSRPEDNLTIPRERPVVRAFERLLDAQRERSP